jgi:lysophospholipase L1-like esterase
MYNILLIGDSHTELGYKNGWGHHMKLWYQNKANVINKGISNYSSQMIKDIFLKLIEKQNFHLCTILLGTNDCYNPNSLISPSIYKENILFMIDTLRKMNPTCLIFLITPPICKIHPGIMQYVEKIYQIIGERSFITLIDLHNGSNKIDQSDLNSDGVHLNSSGNWKIFSNIKDTIENHISFFAPNSLSNK